MTLKVTKEILALHNCCQGGVDNFTNRLGDRTEMDLSEFTELAFEIEKTKPAESYVYFLMELRKSAKFYLLQGAYTMTDKFQVFNHKTGLHEPFNTLEEATARRQELINEYLIENASMFNINQEILVNDGADSMWVPLSELPNP
jgi:hypothetical protein